MKFIFTLKDLVYLGSIFIGFIASLLLISYSWKKKKANILIGLSFFSITYATFFAFLISSGYYRYVPELYRTGNIAALLFAPLSYLYIQRVISDRNFRLVDVLHFLPALIYIIDFFPIFFLTSAEEKLAMILSEIENPKVFAYFNQSRFFPPNFHTLSRTFLIMMYWVLSMRLLFRQGSLLKSSNKTVGSQWILWMKSYQISYLLLFLPFFIFYSFADSQVYYDLIHFTGAFVIFINSATILFFPKILYGLEDPSTYTALPAMPKPEFQEAIPEEKVQEIRDQIHQVLEVNKKFLENGYSIHTLAQDTAIPSYLLTLYINRHLKTTFPEFINRRRIEECCIKIDTGEHKLITLEALGEKCGFNNRNTFISSFKKYKGCTPSQYIKDQMEKAGI